MPSCSSDFRLGHSFNARTARRSKHKISIGNVKTERIEKFCTTILYRVERKVCPIIDEFYNIDLMEIQFSM